MMFTKSACLNKHVDNDTRSIFFLSIDKLFWHMNYSVVIEEDQWVLIGM